MRANWIALNAAFTVLAANFATPSNAQSPALEIRVVPRIGLFNALQYQPEGAPRPKDPLLRPVETNWAPLGQAKYLEIVRSRNPELNSLLPTGPWDMLSTDPDQAGYRSRRLVGLATLEPGATDCNLVFRNPRGQAVALGRPGQPPVQKFEAADCKLEGLPPVHSNEKLAATLEYKLGTSTRTLTAEVPEDLLIVSIGDSYAAGQGNPDGPCDGYFAWTRCKGGNRALWMDERCHRSAQAATIQAGLRLIREGETSPSGRKGAITIASLACSGATLTNGVLGGYEGQISLTEFRQLNADRGLVADDSELEEVRKLKDQLSALALFLGSQDPASAKKTIDVMTMTVGGNDTGFAAALIDMIKRRQQGAQLAEVETVLRTMLDDLRGELPRVRNRLAEMRKDGGYEALQVMYTEYPDPTRARANPDVFCEDVPADGWIGALAGALQLKLSRAESESAYRVVVQGLNRIVADLSLESGWRPVDGLLTDENLIGRGWCAGAPGSKDRWFRKADESMSLQGNIAGAMHPTWQMHDAIATRMRGHIDTAARAKLRAELASAAVESANERVVRSPVGFAIHDEAASGPARLVCYGYPEETCNTTGQFLLDRSRPASTVRMLHAPSARWFSTPVGPLAPDNQPPQLIHCRIAKAGGIGYECGSGEWLAEGDELYAEFEDQGRAGLAHAEWSSAPRDTVTAATATAQKVKGPLRLKSEIPPGRHVIYLAAADRVGNRTSYDVERHTVQIRVDRLAPVFKSVKILGHEFADSTKAFVIPARVKDEVVQVTVRGEDEGSGVRKMEVVVAPGTTEQNRYEQDDPLVCPKLGVLEVRSVWERPFNVAITSRTGGLEERIDARLSASDCAGNAVQQPFALLKIRTPAGDPPPAPPVYWQEPGRFTDALKARVLALAGESALPPSNPSSFRWALAGAWINIAAGMQDPLAKAPGRIRFPSCELEAGESTAFSLIKTAQACLDGPLVEANEAQVTFLAGLAPLLGQIAR